VGARLGPTASSDGPRRAKRGPPAPLDMMRFRPNLVVGGAGLAPFAEDAWRGLQLGAACFRVAGVAPRPSPFPLPVQDLWPSTLWQRRCSAKRTSPAPPALLPARQRTSPGDGAPCGLVNTEPMVSCHCSSAARRPSACVARRRPVRALRGGVHRPRARAAHGPRAAAHAGHVPARARPHPLWAAAGDGAAAARRAARVGGGRRARAGEPGVRGVGQDPGSGASAGGGCALAGLLSVLHFKQQ